jgi:hypothetical protein
MSEHGGVPMTTGELLKPDVEIEEGRCHWWSKRQHCYHRTDCVCYVGGAGTTGRDDCLHRRCCWCGTKQYSRLVVAGHGSFFEKNGETVTMIWTEFRYLGT